jgi:hypothetical protein
MRQAVCSGGWPRAAGAGLLKERLRMRLDRLATAAEKVANTVASTGWANVTVRSISVSGNIVRNHLCTQVRRTARRGKHIERAIQASGFGREPAFDDLRQHVARKE